MPCGFTAAFSGRGSPFHSLDFLMLRSIYGLMFGYIVITTAASLLEHWSRTSSNFLAMLGDALPLMLMFVSVSVFGEDFAMLVIQIARWLLPLLVAHRIFLFVLRRLFAVPFGFGAGWAVVVAIGIGTFILAAFLHLASILLYSEGLAAVSTIPYTMASIYLPLAFVIIELQALRAYAPNDI
jgi:hypothetical protein